MKKREPKSEPVYGAAAIALCLKDVDFPISKKELISQYGSCEIEIEKGETMKLKDVLDYVEDGTYDSPVDLEKALK